MFDVVKVGRPVTYVACLSRGLCSVYSSLVVLLSEYGGVHVHHRFSGMGSLGCNAASTNPGLVSVVKP